MRNTITLILAILILATSCVSKKNVDSVQQERDQLARELEMKDSLINDVFTSMSIIVDNLSGIKSRENIITDNISQGEIPKQYTTTISEDIQAIDELLKENEKTIESLQSKLKQLTKANIKMGGMEKLISQLQQEIKLKNLEIEQLKSNISTMNVQVEQMTTQIVDLESQVSDLSTVNTGLSGEIKAQEQLLNSCYYIVGAEKELITRKIVYKSGFIGRTLKVNENHSLDTYTKIDMSTIDQIHVGHKKVELVTVHPADSYALHTNNDGVIEYIEIKNKKNFWSASKVLIVSYK